VADLNADVRDTASNYRDPAIAAPQDQVVGESLLALLLSKSFAR
jgi:hypothetical protein